ncbi:MAG: DUF881 domain-containing protein [Nocardioides sp.]
MADHPDPRLPEHVTTPLLSLITEQALEQDYRSVAERRAREGAAPDPPRTRTAAAAVIAVFGILISVAAVQNNRNEEVEDAGRTTLISRIGEAREDLEDRQAQIADLTRENLELTDSLTELAAVQQQASSQVRRLQLVTGYLPVTGEGVRMVVNDNPGGDPIQRVTDADLAMLVDGLWEAGAEAIAINDQRLNPLGSIRNVGSAIHVNTVPLTPPYVVRAIGDARTLQGDLLNTTHGAQFFSLADQLGFELSVDDVPELQLPAARQRPLNHVERGTAEQRGDRRVEEGTS